MSAKGDAIMIAGVGLATLGALWYLKSRVSGGLSAAGAAISSGASTAWDTATTPVLDFGSSAVGSTAASVGNGIVSAPANAVDSLSLGLIGGSGGTTGNGGLWGWLSGIVDGSAFAPASATAPDAGIDYGNGTGNW